MIEELNKKHYPPALAVKIEAMGPMAISIANRWAMGWPARVKELVQGNYLLDVLQTQVNQEKEILANEANLRHLARREILALYEINEGPPALEEWLKE